MTYENVVLSLVLAFGVPLYLFWVTKWIAVGWYVTIEALKEQRSKDGKIDG
jgi:hypothetical protein